VGVGDSLAVPMEPRDDDGTLALPDGGQHRSDSGVRDDDTRRPDVFDEVGVFEEVEPCGAGRPHARRTALHDQLLAGRKRREPTQQTVEREPLRAERDEDHAEPRTLPRNSARGTALWSSGHWT